MVALIITTHTNKVGPTYTGRQRNCESKGEKLTPFLSTHIAQLTNLYHKPVEQSLFSFSNNSDKVKSSIFKLEGTVSH